MKMCNNASECTNGLRNGGCLLTIGNDDALPSCLTVEDENYRTSIVSDVAARYESLLNEFAKRTCTGRTPGLEVYPASIKERDLMARYAHKIMGACIVDGIAAGANLYDIKRAIVIGSNWGGCCNWGHNASI